MLTEREVMELIDKANLRFDSVEELNKVRELMENSGFTKKQVALIAIIATSVSTRHVNVLANLAFDTFEKKSDQK